MIKLRTLALGAALGILAGCSSVDLTAPMEDRSTPSTDQPAPVEQPTPAQTVPVPADAPRHLVAEGQPQTSGRRHTVAEGDTIWNISVRYGCNPRELMALNGITDPTTLTLGRELDIPPERDNGSTQVAAAPAGDAPAAVDGTELVAAAPVVAPGQDIAPTVETAQRPASPEAHAQTGASGQSAAGDLSIRWPVQGHVMNNFEQTGRSGIDIGASKGDPVMAVLDGTVVYVGDNSADGYGLFVIVRHNLRLPGKANTPLVTVYGNASKILVKPGESVRAGQKIAEVGDTGSDRTKLRFEVRQGAPLDPMLYLQR